MFDVTVSGRVAKNPELKDLGDGKKACNFTIANKDYHNDTTNWINCSAYGKKAEFISQCINKGDLVVVKGFGLNREERKEDKLMYYFRVNVDEVIFPVSKNTTSDNSNKSKEI